jgi:flagellar FliL protein
MSTATAIDAPPPAKGKKKLIIIIGIVVLVLLAGGGAAVFMLKKGAAAQDEYADEGADGAPAHASARHDSSATPIFVPLDPFTVNLADRQADRYAQIGITLEITEAKTGDQIKAFMPAIRNNILMAIADRTAADLLGREGKNLLAERVRRETARALGYEVEAEPGAEEADAPPAKSRKPRRAAAALPVRAVHFSNFIIQ